MKFSTFLVRINIKDNSFTGITLRGKRQYTANLKRIIGDIFLCNYKTEMDLSFMEEILISSRNKRFTTILPLMSVQNKRKFMKISKILAKEHNNRINDLMVDYLTIEKIYPASRLLEFFKMNFNEMKEILIREEINRRIKIIRMSSLTICSYDYFLKLSKELYSLIKEYHSSRKRTIPQADIEKKLNIPFNGILFKYLLKKVSEDFELKVMKKKMMFENLPLSESEKVNIEDIKHIIKKNRLNVFSISGILKVSGKNQEQVNNALWFMLSEGEIIQVDDKSEYFMFSEELNRIINRLKKFKRNQGEMIDITDLREMTSFNRKNIIILFEYFDSVKITSRVGNKRKLELPV